MTLPLPSLLSPLSPNVPPLPCLLSPLSLNVPPLPSLSPLSPNVPPLPGFAWISIVQNRREKTVLTLVVLFLAGNIYFVYYVFREQQLHNW